MSSNFSLIVSIPGGEPEKFELEGDKVTVGRGPDNGIQILVAEVSVKHAEIAVSPDGCTFTDLGSTNGTKINGKKLGSEGIGLEPMDKIIMGETVPVYFVPTAVTASTPLDELIKSIDAAPKAEATTPATAPVAVAAAAPTPVAPVAKAAPSGGAQTVRLDQVKPSAPGPARPAAPKPANPGAPRPAAPAAPIPAGGAKPAPVKPAPVQPGGVKPATPAAPGGAKPPAVAAPAAPKAPTPGGAPAAPKPVPLKRPAPQVKKAGE